MAQNIAFAACIFFAAHGGLAGYFSFRFPKSRNLAWEYATYWALAWAFAYIAMI